MGGAKGEPATRADSRASCPGTHLLPLPPSVSLHWEGSRIHCGHQAPLPLDRVPGSVRAKSSASSSWPFTSWFLSAQHPGQEAAINQIKWGHGRTAEVQPLQDQEYQGMSGVGEEEDRQTHTDGCVEEVAFLIFRIAQFL